MMKKILNIIMTITMMCVLGTVPSSVYADPLQDECFAVVEAYYERMYDSYLSMNLEDFSDVLDMDMTQNTNKIMALQRVIENWKYAVQTVDNLEFPERLRFSIEVTSFSHTANGYSIEVNITTDAGIAYPIFISRGLNTFRLHERNGNMLIYEHDYDGLEWFEQSKTDLAFGNLSAYIMTMHQNYDWINNNSVQFTAAMISEPVPLNTVYHAFNFQRAKNYALAYSYNPNPHFYYYSGANCTNFISQLVAYGFGATEDASLLNTSYRMTPAWWGGASGGSTNWVGVDEFFTYLHTPKTVGPTVATTDPTGPCVGAIMQLYSANYGFWKHSAYIFAYEGGNYKCAQNSTNTIHNFYDYSPDFTQRRYCVPTYFLE